MLDPKKLESLIWEARARVIWGESGDSIAAWLADEGVEPHTIDEVLDASFRERNKEVRSKGLVEAMIGGAIAAMSAACMYAMVFSGFANSKIFALCMMGGAYGLFRFTRGLTWLMQGKNVSGAVGDLDS